MALGDPQTNVFFYKDIETGIMIEELPQDVAYEVVNHVVILKWDKFFHKYVHVHTLTIRSIL